MIGFNRDKNTTKAKEEVEPSILDWNSPVQMPESHFLAFVIYR
jgi:hypothetical protein